MICSGSGTASSLPDRSDPFENDVLGRELQVKAFYAVLAGICSPPRCCRWTRGGEPARQRSSRMCTAWMRSQASPHTDMAVAEFNAWTQSYTGKPLKDIVEAVTSQITDADTGHQRKIARLLEQLSSNRRFELA